MRKVALESLTPDMVLAKPVYHLNSLLLKVGTNHLKRYVGSLSRLGITHLYVTDKISEDIEIEDALSLETRLHCKEFLFTTISRLGRQGVMDMSGLSESAEEIMDEILQNPEVLVSMNEIGTSDDSTFNHSVNTAIYGIILARELGYPKSRIKKLVLGLLLHDIGKTMLDQKILYKPEKLTGEEFEHVKTHTTLGYEALQKCSGVTEISKIIVLHHHERLDGSGYPNHLKGDEIHEFVRIASIVDVYDAVVSERCYHQKQTIAETVGLLKAEAAGKLDERLLALFIRCLAIYPNGTMVKLSDGTTGIVKCQNQNMPYRPVVRVVRDRLDKRIPLYDVDLSKDLGMKIEEEKYVDREIKQKGD